MLLDNANHYIHSTFQEQVKYIYQGKILSRMCLQITEHLTAPSHQHELCWLKNETCFHPSFSGCQCFRMTFWAGWRHSKWPTGFGEIWRDWSIQSGYDTWEANQFYVMYAEIPFIAAANYEHPHPRSAVFGTHLIMTHICIYRTSLVQIMACRLYGAKPLSDPKLAYYELNPKEQTLIDFQSKYPDFHIKD